MLDDAVLVEPDNSSSAFAPPALLRKYEMLPRGAALRTALGFEGGLGVVALLAGWALGIPLIAACVPRSLDIGLGIAALGPMLALFFACLLLDLGPLNAIRDILDESLPSLLGSCTVGDLALISAAAGVGEELLFRGVLQVKLVGWCGQPVGVVGASLIFGLAHCVTPAYFVLTALIGLYLGWLAQVSDGLSAPIIAHGAYDFIALVYLLKLRSRRGRA